MPTPDIERLRAVKTLPQLIAYLRDELDWPIETEDIEDLTFDYEPKELGLDTTAAVKVKEIKQLRPLTGNQPWGIFFVNFEKKRLPVVIMRRILRALVLKKRASANKAERQSWQPNDLMFISAYGEETDRAITFAHFVENKDYSNLAELRVLGWDDDDTPLKYDYIAHTLQEKLRWRDEFEENHDLWRQNWREAFVLRHREVITTSRELALALAGLAKRIRGRVRSILRYEDGFGQIRRLQRAFQQGLIHDLDDEAFADMLSQTVTYGLFSVAVRRTFPGEGTAVIRDDVPNLIFTSPFLKEMMGIFLGIKSRKGRLDFDELGVTDVEEVLRSPDTHMEAVLRDFGNRTRQEDPVIHFYELFLIEYDKKRKVQRGVFYTPQPVVSYIVRSVHELLQTEFGLEDGLASTTTWREMLKKHPALKLPPLTDEPEEKRTISPDEPFVQILDPATGTGTFLVEVIDVIYKTMVAKWKNAGKSDAQIKAAWNDYVPKYLLPRVYGFELMMAPYAIAHMKIGLKLSETGYRFRSDERARIYLTNSLEPKVRQLPAIGFEALTHEAAAVNEIKWYKCFTVVIGNPPYAYMSANLTVQSRNLVNPYRFVNGKKIVEKGALVLERALQDDYVKFFAFAEKSLRQTGVGFISMISNSAYLKNPNMRGMRNAFSMDFDCFLGMDLNGDVKNLAEEDQNVFDIRTGVAICLLERLGRESRKPFKCAISELIGSRKRKESCLGASTLAKDCTVFFAPKPPQFLFDEKTSGDSEYDHWFPISEIFSITSVGIKTNRDDLVIDFADREIQRRLDFLMNNTNSLAKVKSVLGIEDNAQWSVADGRKECRHTYSVKHFKSLAYRPFDVRRIYYHGSVVFNPRPAVMMHLLRPANLALVSNRRIRTKEHAHFFVVNRICMAEMLSSADNCNVYPLYLFDDDLISGSSNRPNLSNKFLKAVASKLGLLQTAGHSLPKSLTSENLFHYMYAVFHSPTYRSRYADFLKIDFPHLPLTSSLDLFRALAKLGGELVALHLMESSKLDKHITKWVGGKNPEVEKVMYSDKTVWIDKAQTKGFKGVPEFVWNFHVGGYQVCEKWLKDRKGRTLSKDDIEHYHRIVVALSETIKLMTEIDRVIEAHGGWPIK